MGEGTRQYKSQSQVQSVFPNNPGPMLNLGTRGSPCSDAEVLEDQAPKFAPWTAAPAILSNDRSALSTQRNPKPAPHIPVTCVRSLMYVHVLSCRAGFGFRCVESALLSLLSIAGAAVHGANFGA
jgi:hypothetical protein